MKKRYFYFISYAAANGIAGNCESFFNCPITHWEQLESMKTGLEEKNKLKGVIIQNFILLRTEDMP